MYGIVKDGEIIEFIKTLPKSNETISGLDKLSPEQLRELGYYKIIGASEPLEEWQSYGQSSYEIGEEYITETKEVLNEELESFKNRKITEQSEKTKRIIHNKYSEIEQTNLLRESMRLQFNLNTGQEVDIERVVYIQNVDKWIEEQRANYKELKEQILNATTYEEVMSLIPNDEELGV